MSDKIVIAIDGPAGAGKSTVAKGLAKRLGYAYVDTGAIYRCVALMAREQNVLPMDFRQNTAEDQRLKSGEYDAKLQTILKELADETPISFGWKDDQHQVFIGERNVSGDIRNEANSQAASSVSARPLVREALLDFQRQMGRSGGAVFEGRDIGTVVFPKAQLKVYMTASVSERARRRYEEAIARGQQVERQEIEKSIRQRDEQDRNRKTAPLKPAQDARELDSTELSIDQVIQQILSWVPRGAYETEKAG